MSSFLGRSLRRTLHEQHQGQILKAISAGQNLEVYPPSLNHPHLTHKYDDQVAEKTWLFLREQGGVIEEPTSDDEGDGAFSDGDEEKSEKPVDAEAGVPGSLSEKIGMHEQHEGAALVDEIRVGSLSSEADLT